MAEGVYGLLLEGGIAVEGQEEASSEPAFVEIEEVEKDPRKVTLYCDGCGKEATYSFKTVKRLLGVCSSSTCIRKALDKLERWAKMAKSKGWELIEGDVLDPAPPKLTALQEIQLFQREHGLVDDGIVGRATEEALRKVGRAGMILIWREKLKEEADE